MADHSQKHKVATKSPLNLTLYKVFLPFLLLLPMLAACGNNANNGKIQLVLWYWDTGLDDTLVNQVNTVFPNIHLTAEKISDFDDKLRTSMAAQNGVPDITTINSNIATYFPDEDQFYDLRTLVQIA